MSKVRTAIVGLGMAVKPHAESYLELADRVEVAYAFSPSEARRRVFAQQYPFRLVDSFNQILEDDSVHFVSILTPPNTHLELVRRCAAAGKHVLLEKPLEIDFNRAVALIDTCEQAGVKLGVVLQHRFRPSGERLRALLADRALGRIVGASVSVLNWRPQSYYDQPGRGDKDRDGGGVLITQGIHTLDLCRINWIIQATHAGALPAHLSGIGPRSSARMPVQIKLRKAQDITFERYRMAPTRRGNQSTRAGLAEAIASTTRWLRRNGSDCLIADS